MSKKKKFYPLILTVLLFLVLYLLGTLVSQESLRSLIDSTGAIGPIVVILMALLTYIIVPLSSAPVIIVGYYAYGRNVIFLISIAALISFISNFWISRKYGRVLVEKFAGRHSMDKVDKLTKHYGLVALFFLRIFQGIIHDYVSYAAGLTSLKFSSYITVSTLALIPHTLIWYFFSLRANSPVSFITTTAVIGFSLSFLFIIFSIVFVRIKG